MDATCQTPKVCAVCGITEGETDDHSWADATCQSPKICTACQIREGTNTSHVYNDGKCVTCDRRQLGFGKWQSYYVEDDQLSIVEIDFDTSLIYLTGYRRVASLDSVALENLMQYNHSVVTYGGAEYIDCLGDGCTINYETNDEIITITLMEGLVGSIILERIGPQDVKVIGVTGSTYFTNKDWIFVYQYGSSSTEQSTTDASSITQPTSCGHSWESATCVKAKTCKLCGITEGEANGHNWKDATCTSPKVCTTCNETIGAASAHNYTNGKCANCGSNDPDYVQETLVWIPTHGGTKYHRKSSCSQMKDPVQVTKSEAINRGFEPCGRCY